MDATTSPSSFQPVQQPAAPTATFAPAPALAGSMTLAEQRASLMANPAYLSEATHERVPLVREVARLGQEIEREAQAAQPIDPRTGAPMPAHLQPADDRAIMRQGMEIASTAGLDGDEAMAFGAQFKALAQQWRLDETQLGQLVEAVRDGRSGRFQTEEEAADALRQLCGCPNVAAEDRAYAAKTWDLMKQAAPNFREALIASGANASPHLVRALATLGRRFAEEPGRGQAVSVTDRYGRPLRRGDP